MAIRHKTCRSSIHTQNRSLPASGKVVPLLVSQPFTKLTKEKREGEKIFCATRIIVCIYCFDDNNNQETYSIKQTNTHKKRKHRSSYIAKTYKCFIC